MVKKVSKNLCLRSCKSRTDWHLLKSRVISESMTGQLVQVTGQLVQVTGQLVQACHQEESANIECYKETPSQENMFSVGNIDLLTLEYSFILFTILG